MRAHRQSNTFQSFYRKLNPQQKKAVDTIEGPVLVIAGPGTGKTQVLTLRIANILKRTDTPAEAVLALTFTEKATIQMRRRLIEIIGQDAYRVHIRTFHSFCNEIIHREPDHFPRIIGGTHVSDADRLRLLEEIVATQPLTLLRPLGRPEAYISAIQGAIDDLKREGVSPKAFRALIAQEEKALTLNNDLTDDAGATRAKYRAQGKAIQKQKELLLIYEAYQKILEQKNHYDYADMLMEVAAALRNDEELRASLQERYLYILVDEHQDTNRTQNEIVEQIGAFHSQPNIFAVGDMQQAIFRFQGASLANFQNFMRQYPSARVITLKENYRSTPAILGAAKGVSPNQERLIARVRHKNIPVRFYAFSSPAAQEYALGKMIQERIASGIRPEEIAILFRTNAEAAPLARMLERMDVPHVIESDEEVLEDSEIQKLLLLARTITHVGDDTLLAQALCIDFLNLPPLDAFKISAAAFKEKRKIWDVFSGKKYHEKLDLEDVKRTGELSVLFSSLASRTAHASAAHALEVLVRQTGFLAYIMQKRDGERALNKLHSLFDLIRVQMESHKQYRLIDFLDTLDRIQRHGTSLRIQNMGLEHAVRLMTVHKAKGLEFDVVYLMNTAHGHWDGARRPATLKLPDSIWHIGEVSPDDPEDDLDMRNLFYVGLTRARKEAIVAWPERKADGKEQLPSKFVLAIPSVHGTYADAASWNNAYDNDKAIQFVEREQNPRLTDKAYLNELFQNQPFSVTALNNYLKCPWRYFFINLVRIPEAPTISAEYGKAAHEALRVFFNYLKKHGDPGKKYLLGSFSNALRRAPLPKQILDQALLQGKRALSGYYAQYARVWHPHVLTEQAIDGVTVGKLSLTGKLDKIELLYPGQDRVNVVDYKTKAPVSANELLGKTKNADGREFRQLVFYKLLLDNWQKRKYKMETGEIDFLEPNPSGKYKKEKFTITKEHTRQLQDTLGKVRNEILNLSFWNKRCYEKECAYCGLRNLMK